MYYRKYSHTNITPGIIQIDKYSEFVTIYRLYFQKKQNQAQIEEFQQFYWGCQNYSMYGLRSYFTAKPEPPEQARHVSTYPQSYGTPLSSKGKKSVTMQLISKQVSTKSSIFWDITVCSLLKVN
jgi:hypothetical protein